MSACVFMLAGLVSVLGYSESCWIKIIPLGHQLLVCLGCLLACDCGLAQSLEDICDARHSSRQSDTTQCVYLHSCHQGVVK